MKSNIRKWTLSLVLGLVAVSGVASAATNAVGADPSQLRSKVRRELRTHLSYYSLFDLLSYRVEGSKVTLMGKVSWPSLKPTAERLVANLEGVTSVENQIEVLPTSFHDDRIRLATTRALFSNGFLSKYAWFGSHGHSHGRFYGHPYGHAYAYVPYQSDIHIIVKNGDVTLEGVVRSKTDSDVAFLMANGVFGAFSVTNNLRVENPKKKEG